MTRYCIHCGETEENHCPGFETVKLPEGCQCDPREWGSSTPIPLVCDHYEPNDDSWPVCKHCEHDEECHKEYK